MAKFIKILSTTIFLLILTSSVSLATDINMNLESSNTYSNSVSNHTSNTNITTVSGQSSTVSSVQENENLTTSDVINILLIVVGIVLILLGIAVLIRIHKE